MSPTKSHDPSEQGDSPEIKDSLSFHRWAQEINLNLLVRYHNDMRGLILRSVAAEEEAVSPLVESAAERYMAMNAANGLLFALAFLEEELWHAWHAWHRARQVEVEEPPRGSSLKRYADLLTELGLDLGGLAAWSRIQDATVVRHCLLHAHGRVTLMRSPSPKRIRTLAKRAQGLAIKQDRLVVDASFLRDTVDSIRELLSEIHEALVRTLNP